MAKTLEDVAKLAGVSISTASRALRDDRARPVALETQERIWEAVRQLNYEPKDAAARRLVHRVGNRVRRTYNVGLILGNASYKFSDPFWSPVLDGIDEELIRQEYHLLFAFLSDDLTRRHQRRLLSLAHIDGLILVGGVRLGESPIGADRIVVIEGGDDERWRAPMPVDMVIFEKRRAMYDMVDHLVALGRRRLAFLGPSIGRDERAEAFTHALARHDMSSLPDQMIEAPWSAEGAYQVATALLGARGADFDAVVCGCDTIAIGAMRAARECGLHVPDDLAITGFDDIPFARDLDPALTTVNVPKGLMGELAARKLIERIERPAMPPITQVVPTNLVVRASCGSPEPARYVAGGTV